MNKQTKLISALTTAAKKAPDKAKLKTKIKSIKQRQVKYDWLAQ